VWFLLLTLEKNVYKLTPSVFIEKSSFHSLILIKGGKKKAIVYLLASLKNSDLSFASDLKVGKHSDMPKSP